MKNDYVTVREAAKILGVNPETLRRWDNSGKLKAKRHKMSNYRLYSIGDVQKIKKDIVK